MKHSIGHSLILMIIITVVSVFFYPTIWRQVILSSPDEMLVIQGETPIYEFVAETVRQNILSGKNPFEETRQVLYPIGWKYAMDDVAPINGFYFLFLRPFLGIHQSLMMIVLGSVIASSLTMFILLRQLKIGNLVALLSCLIFGFTPFVSERIGAHPTYVALYLFVLPVIFWLRLISVSPNRKVWPAVWLGIGLALPFVTNLYFAVMLAVMIIVSLVMYGLFFPRKTKEVILVNWRYLLLSIVTMLVVLSPWIKEVGSIILFETMDKASDWKDIISYSADLTNIFIPSHFNPLYLEMVSKLGNNYAYVRTAFETFIYPGILLIVLAVTYLFLSKRLSPYLRPIFISAILFLLMTFGPYLQIFGYNYKIPLPYILIPYIPYIQMARAPGRFVVVFIFLMTIIVAHTLQYLMKKKLRSRWQMSVFALILGVFFLDQRVVLPPPTTVILPITIYDYLAKQPQATPLLEIPFSIRDSIKYYGYIHSFYSSYGTLLHHQPIFGVYAGRVPNHIFTDYSKNPIIGPIGKMIDLETTDPNAVLEEIDYPKMEEMIDVYRMRYVIVKNDERFSTAAELIMTRLEFEKKITDGLYTLWYKDAPIGETAYFAVEEGSQQFTLIRGWGNQEDGESGRWAVGRKSELLFWLNSTDKKQFILEAEAIVKPQKVQVFLNNIKIGKITVAGNGYSRYVLPISIELKPGENMITLQFESTHQLSKLIPGSHDERQLALHVKYIGLE